MCAVPSRERYVMRAGQSGWAIYGLATMFRGGWEEQACHGVHDHGNGCTTVGGHRAGSGQPAYPGICGSSSPRVPARFLGLEPVANALAMVLSQGRVDVIGTVAKTLAQCHHAEALALATSVSQRVKLRAQPLAYGGRQADQFAREFVQGVAQAKAQACPWK